MCSLSLFSSKCYEVIYFSYYMNSYFGTLSKGHIFSKSVLQCANLLNHIKTLSHIDSIDVEIPKSFLVYFSTMFLIILS